MGTDNFNNKTVSMLKIVPLRHIIDKLMVVESKSSSIKSLCKQYINRLDNGEREVQLCESFAKDLAAIAKSKTANNVVEKLNNMIAEQESNIKFSNCVEALKHGSCMYVEPVIENALVEYMCNKNSVTRDGVRVAVSLFEGDNVVKQIIDILNYESYVEKSGKKLFNAPLLESEKEKKPRTYTQAEVDAIIENKIADAKAAEIESKTKHNGIKSRIGLSRAISKIMKECRNEKLRVFCDQYVKALNEGKAEEVLYESFISGISNWNYLSAVDTEISAMNDRVKKYKQDIDLKKILKIMESTGSYYIVPLIEDVLYEYVDHKNMTNRAILMQRLTAFEYDPFVRDIIGVITRDLSIENSVYLGESIETPNKYVHTEVVHSPVLYIKENVSVFNVKGYYYVKSGNNISKMTRKEVASLSESFKKLCDVVNSPNVKIMDDINTIKVYGDNDVAVITESEVRVNDKKMGIYEIKSAAKFVEMTNESNASFYGIVDLLNENFNDISCIDFVKRVSSNDGCGKAVDVFKIKNNIYVNMIDESLGNSTFYRNVNPIQCKSYINEHMGVNISSLFEDVLPEQKVIERSISDKKNAYEDYLKTLEDKKETLEKMKDEGADEDDINKAIDMIDKEIDDTKAEYKKYQDDADKFLKGDDDDKDDDIENEVPDIDDDDDDKGEDDDKDDDADDDADNTKDDKEKDDLDDTYNSGETSPDETETDMEQPIDPSTENGGEDTNMEDGDEVFDKSFDDTTDVPEYDSYFDDISTPDKTDVDGIENNNVEDNHFQVVKVSYNRNVKTGKYNGRGEVIVVIPSVDANGDVHDETRKVTFYLDNEHKPVINNEYMPLDMYMTIKSAIEESPETSNVDFDSSDINSNEEPKEDDKGGFSDEKLDTETASDSADDFDFGDLEDNGETDNTENTESSEESDIKDFFDKVDDINVDDILPKESDEDNKSIEKVERETPAETAEGESEPSYPIEIGLYPEEIAPKDMADFEKDLDKMKISHSETEAHDGEICMKVCNKAQAHALKKYFKEWMDYSDDNFKSFFPELKKCFDNDSPNIPVQPTNEEFKIIVPQTKDYCKLFGIEYNSKFSHMTLVAESKEEANKMYAKLYMYANKKKGNVEDDVIDILERYYESYGKGAAKIIKNSNYNLVLPYSNLLEQKISAKGFNVLVENEKMSIVVDFEEYNKMRKILESFYGSDKPSAVKKFINFLNEGVIITVKDDSTGKTVEINTDDFNGKSGKDVSDSGDSNEAADFESSFKDTTFDQKESMIFKDTEEDSDEENEKSKDEDKKSEENKDEKSDEDTEKEDSSEEDKGENGTEDKEGEDKKGKKKFTFKPKSKNESMNVPEDCGNVTKLNENLAKPTVLDYVNTPDGKGQVISQLPDKSLIVNIAGHTLVYPQSKVSMVKDRPDNLDFPVKFDSKTLKGLVESYVSCGLFMNDVCVTPPDCKVKLSEFMNCASDKEVELIIEGEKTPCVKKYVRVLENLNDVLDIGNYIEGKMSVLVEGQQSKVDVLINKNDYRNYKLLNDETMPVKILVYESNGETRSMYASGSVLNINVKNDEYTPEYINLIESAVTSLN